MMKLLFLTFLVIPISGSLAMPRGMQRTFADSVTTETYKVLILGNSITTHTPAPQLGWVGNWGMAASDSTKDYVHILKSRMQQYRCCVSVNYGNIANRFERKFWAFDTADFKRLRDFSPNLLILRIGENIADSLAISKSLDVAIEKLVTYIASNPSTTVCLVGSFWPKKNVTKVMSETCTRNGWLFVDLKGLYDEAGVNTAKGLYKNPEVARHPSDAGMAAIADRIWDKIEHLFKR